MRYGPELLLIVIPTGDEITSEKRVCSNARIDLADEGNDVNEIEPVDPVISTELIMIETSEPFGPVGPVAPTGPNPVGPVAPVGPAEATSPVGPERPTGPVTNVGSNNPGEIIEFDSRNDIFPIENFIYIWIKFNGYIMSLYFAN